MVRRAARALPVVIAAAVVIIGAIVGFAPAATPVVPSQVEVTTTAADPASLTGSWRPPMPKPPTSFMVADALGSQVHLFSEPDVPMADRPVMDNPTWEGLPLTYLVLEEHGPWLKVRVSARPNGLVGWIQRAEVLLRTVGNRVRVELAAHRVTVLHGDDVLLQAAAVIGAPGSPTPTGSFFVDGIVPLLDNPSGPYGAYQVSVSGFSDTYQRFGGGVGQIALHGTVREDQLGQDISHGCVRLANDAITEVARLAPLGTPVEILP